jgi:hypothetical protein
VMPQRYPASATDEKCVAQNTSSERPDPLMPRLSPGGSRQPWHKLTVQQITRCLDGATTKYE